MQIIIFIECGDRTRIPEVGNLFISKYPGRLIRIFTGGKIERNVREIGQVKDSPKINNNTELDKILEVENNLFVIQWTVLNALNERYYRYKIKLLHELNEDDSDYYSSAKLW